MSIPVCDFAGCGTIANSHCDKCRRVICVRHTSYGFASSIWCTQCHYEDAAYTQKKENFTCLFWLFVIGVPLIVGLIAMAVMQAQH